MRFALLSRAAGVLWLAAVLASPVRTAAAPGDDLPEGPGKKILLASCTTCHDLEEVTKFRGFYDRAAWRDIVVTMVEYGARLDAAEIDTLAEYLAAALARK